MDAARLLEIERGIIAEVYACDAMDGWHLTSHFVRQEPRVLRYDQSVNTKKKTRKISLGKALGKEFFEQLKNAINTGDNK